MVFHIESPDVKIFLELSENKNFQIQLGEYFSPYNGECNTFDVFMEKKHLGEFLNMIRKYRQKSAVRIYTKEEDYYRPFLIEEPKFQKIYNTFFYRILKNSEHYVEEMEDLDYNFLELFEVAEESPNNYKGYYKSLTLIPRSTRITNTDTGSFQMQIETEDQNSCITTSFENIRIYQDFYYPSPYSKLMNLKNKNGLTKGQMKEYFVRFTEECLIHFADNLNIIEVWFQNKELKMIQKQNPNSEWENEIIEFVNNYQKEINAKRIKVKN